MQQITAADIRAIGDIADAITDQIETFTIEQAVTFCDLLEDVGKRIAAARHACEAKAKALLDGQPATIAGKVYIEEATGKWRPQQPKIRERVAVMAAHDSSGRALSATVAAQRAVDLMYALFVSPSQMPKQGGMKQLGLQNEDIAEWEETGSQLKVTSARGTKARGGR